jgi:hypothetical protein
MPAWPYALVFLSVCFLLFLVMLLLADPGSLTGWLKSIGKHGQKPADSKSPADRRPRGHQG